MVAGSHYGGNLTHGEGFFTIKQDIKPTITIAEFTAKTTVYDGAVQPILAAKCMECHNDQKTKGGLNMKNLASMLKGGKSGSMWVSGDLTKV